MELTATHALRVFTLKSLRPLDDAANFTRMAPAAPQEKVLQWLQPIDDLASGESIERQVFLTYFAQKHASAALACRAGSELNSELKLSMHSQVLTLKLYQLHVQPSLRSAIAISNSVRATT